MQTLPIFLAVKYHNDGCICYKVRKQRVNKKVKRTLDKSGKMLYTCIMIPEMVSIQTVNALIALYGLYNSKTAEQISRKKD